MKYTFNERVEYEIKRRTTRDSQKEFFRNAVDRIRYGKSLNKTIQDKEFACTVLCGTGFCLHYRCERCLIERIFANSVDDFRLGIK